MRKAFALLVLGVLLAGGTARAEEAASTEAAAADSNAFLESLQLDPLQGAIPLLPLSCPVLCTNVQGTTCSYGQTRSCYDYTGSKVCITCYCGGGNKFWCWPEN